VIQKPEALVTADPGLATVPPEQLALPTDEQKPASQPPEAEAPAPPAEPSPNATGTT
jgi:hypothetical protein